MCTAITFKTKDFYFGRTLDDTISRGEKIIITPRKYPFLFRNMETMDSHYAMIGMACVGKMEDEKTSGNVSDHDKRMSFSTQQYPLYYDAVNEKGLAMAGLNFVGNAYYTEVLPEKENVAQFEFIPWILGQCATVKEARRRLERLTVTQIAFSDHLPPAQLHWMLADKEEAVVIEAVKEGLQIYDNPAGVLTNNPPFPEQLFRLNDYMHVSPGEPKNLFCDKLPLKSYSLGMGALGLPGDLSSGSRFVRAVFTRMHVVPGDSEEENVGQFFHILGSVEQQKGCCQVGKYEYERTIYTSCCNTRKGIYYYTTYANHQITAVDMHKENLDGTDLVRYPQLTGEHIYRQN